MCIERLRRHAHCRQTPNHGYWQVDLCYEALAKNGTPCDVRVKETPIILPAPLGVECCPMEGCSVDPRHQLKDTTLSKGGKKGWGSRFYPVSI